MLFAVLAAVFLAVNVYRLSTAVIAEPLMAAFDTTGAQLGTLHATFFYVYAVMQIPTGILVDRVGPRRTAAVGAFVMNLGAIWFALTGSYTGALAARLLIGLGGSVIFVSMLRFCASWYRSEEFATMSGVCFAVGGVGGILATTPFALAVEAAGWRETLLALGAVGLVVSALTYALVRDSPERAGLRSIEGVPEQARLTMGEVRTYTRRALADRSVWVVSLLLFCTGGVNLTLFGLWGVPYVVQTYGTTVTVASVVTLLGGLGSVLGPPAIGWLSDRVGERTQFIIVGCLVFTLGLALIAVIGDPPLPVVGLVFFINGVLLGTFVLTYPMVKERHPSRASGISLGSVNGASFLGAALLPTVMGRTLDAYWTGEVVGGARVYTATGYRLAFAIATLCGVIAVACAVWLHLQSGPDDREVGGSA
ncbi:MFS transporter [Halorubrum vacuolatum]|uniref:Lysosomal dipeptide transporter MFSD1 n=1 Tax=Halorubrum vacuolatum TaxID=63740 RepID=A0A238WRV0_HALVU|nr:MFS transporter [Halorubrum vacuolatum]SNR49111.1 Sugar phosphate permease [Halorubrum vacuolatum]